MKNFLIVVLVGIVFFLAVSLFYQSRKDFVTEIEGLGNMSYAIAREKAAISDDKKKNSDIKIGLVGNCGYDRFQSLEKGVKLACDEINKAGGVNGRKIKILIKDTEGKLSKLKISAQKFAEDTSVTALISGFNYMELTSLAPLCEYNGLLLMSPVVTSGIFPDQATMKMVFTNYPDIGSLLEIMYKFLETNNLKSTAIISSPEYTYGYYFANAFDSQISRNLVGTAGIVKRDIWYENSPAQVRKTFHIWDPKTPFDNMLVCGGRETARNVITFAYGLNPDAVYMLTDEMEIEELLKTKIGKLKIFLPSVYDAESTKEANKKFSTLFNQKFGRNPDIWAAQGYDTLMVIAKGMKEAGTSSPSAVADALFKIKYTDNVSSAPYIAFDSKGLLLGASPVIKYPVDGEFRVLKSLDIKDMVKPSVNE